MRFKEEVNFAIAAPQEQVWMSFIDFASWPKWSPHVKEVTREGSGWRFRARGQPMVDLVFVLEATRRHPPHYLEFASLPNAAHNVELRGWVEFSTHTDQSTQMYLVVEGSPHYQSALLNNLAHWWVATFDEPSKIVKATFEEFKRHLESHPAPPTKARSSSVQT